MLTLVRRLIEPLGNSGAIKNAGREVHRLDDAVAAVEALALKLALLERRPAA
jgi:hypothetical protein